MWLYKTLSNNTQHTMQEITDDNSSTTFSSKMEMDLHIHFTLLLDFNNIYLLSLWDLYSNKKMNVSIKIQVLSYSCLISYIPCNDFSC